MVLRAILFSKTVHLLHWAVKRTKTAENRPWHSSSDWVVDSCPSAFLAFPSSSLERISEDFLYNNVYKK